MTQSLQDTYAPNNACFGCGPANEKGLRLKSFVEGDECVCTWTPEKHHEAFEGMLNGGICGSLLDCHSNWTAAWTLMNNNGDDTPPCTKCNPERFFSYRRDGKAGGVHMGYISIRS